MLHDTRTGSSVSPRERNLELINAAIAATRTAIFSCVDEVAKAHLEYVLAFLNESWIAEDGQQSRSSEQIVSDVAYVQNLESVFEKLHQTQS